MSGLGIVALAAVAALALRSGRAPARRPLPPSPPPSPGDPASDELDPDAVNTAAREAAESRPPVEQAFDPGARAALFNARAGVPGHPSTGAIPVRVYRPEIAQLLVSGAMTAGRDWNLMGTQEGISVFRLVPKSPGKPPAPAPLKGGHWLFTAGLVIPDETVHYAMVCSGERPQWPHVVAALAALDEHTRWVFWSP